jgi:hypothetical protein
VATSRHTNGTRSARWAARFLQIGPAAWNAGTPEPDRAGGQQQGTALLVDIPVAGAPPSVTPLITGTYRWVTRTERLGDQAALADLEQRLRAESDLPRIILRLQLEGSVAASRWSARAARRNSTERTRLASFDADRSARGG